MAMDRFGDDGPMIGQASSKAMLDGLTNMVRDNLRKRIVEKIQPDIDAAVEDALASFKAAIETYRDPLHMRDTVRVLIERAGP
jgi:hypothetical protein